MDVAAPELPGQDEGRPVLGFLIGLPMSISLWALAAVMVLWALRG